MTGEDERGSSPSIGVLQLLGPSAGGIRRHVATLQDSLGRSGVCSDVAGPAGVMAPLGIAAQHVEVSARVSPRAVVSAVRQLRGVLNASSGIDIIHAHGLKPGLIALLARPRQPIVLTVHNIVLDESSSLVGLAERRLEGFIIDHCDAVVAASSDVAEQLGIDASEPSFNVILPSSPAPIARRTRAEVRAGLGVEPDTVLVVVVARLHPQKDLETFVSAWAMAMDALQASDAGVVAQAVVVGDGPLREALQSHIDDCSLGDSLRLIGESEHGVDEIAAADVFSLSSTWEGVPFVGVEAVALGRPIVATRVGVLSEMIGGGRGGRLVDVKDARGLANALVEVIENEELRTEMGRYNATNAAKHLSPEVLVDDVAALYRRVLSDQ